MSNLHTLQSCACMYIHFYRHLNEFVQHQTEMWMILTYRTMHIFCKKDLWALYFICQIGCQKLSDDYLVLGIISDVKSRE